MESLRDYLNSNEKFFSEKLLEELKNYYPPVPMPRPRRDRVSLHGFDWDYELDRLKERMHNKIDGAREHQRMLDIFQDAGMLFVNMPMQARIENRFIVGIDPIA